MEKHWTWRPKDQRIAENEQILDAIASGERPSDIVARLGITRGTVSGVIARAKAAHDPRASPSAWSVRRAARQAHQAKRVRPAAGSQE